MISLETLSIGALMFLAALLYSSVGHAGASGYIAIMAMFGVAPAVMKPTALCLNILVAALATWRLWRAGLIAPSAVWPYLIGSVPMAFLGGAVQLSAPHYKTVVGVVLLVAAARIFITPRERVANPDGSPAAPPMVWALPIGVAIGFLAGLTGTGGGIFLSPIVLLLGWAGTRQSAGIAAPFILANSIAGLAGNWLSLKSLPAELPLFAVMALGGALIGTQLVIKWFSPAMLQRTLALVLVIAGLKLTFT
jgi:uncharacterized membrane protein YfcA